MLGANCVSVSSVSSLRCQGAKWGLQDSGPHGNECQGPGVGRE